MKQTPLTFKFHKQGNYVWVFNDYYLTLVPDGSSKDLKTKVGLTDRKLANDQINLTVMARQRMDEILEMDERNISLSTLNETLKFVADILQKQQEQLENIRLQAVNLQEDLNTTWAMFEQLQQIQRNLSTPVRTDSVTAPSSHKRQIMQTNCSDVLPKPKKPKMSELEGTKITISAILFCS